MSAVAAEHAICAWKVYTHAGPGWYLDDHDPDALHGRRGVPAATSRQLGVNVVAVHKGLSGGSAFASPVDIGPAAANHPGHPVRRLPLGLRELGTARSSSTADGSGVDRLIASVAGGRHRARRQRVRRARLDVAGGDGRPDQAAHVLGKLLVAVGEDNIVWGTDCIWYGSPQDQIDAFRAFEITPEFQERFGYPALTDRAQGQDPRPQRARVFGIDTRSTTTCSPAEQGFPRAESPLANRLLGPVTRRDILPPSCATTRG